MVEDDLHDLGLFDYYNRKGHIDHPSKVHHWQLGLGIWYLSEMLNLVNFFLPFKSQLKKAQMQQEINKLKELRLNYVNSKKQYKKRQNPFRRF